MSAGTSQHTNDSGEFDFGKLSKSSPTVINEQSFMDRLAKLQEITIREEFVLECNRLIDYLGKNSDLSPSNLNRAFNDLRQTIRILHTITGDVQDIEQSDSPFIRCFFKDVKTSHNAVQYHAFLHLSEAYCALLPEILRHSRLNLIMAEISLEIGDPFTSVSMFTEALKCMRCDDAYIEEHREEAMQYLIRFGEVNYFLGRYENAVQNYESALELSISHKIPIAENDAGIVMSHYAFAYTMHVAGQEEGYFNNVFEQSPPFVTLSSDTQLTTPEDREIASRRIGNKFFTLSCMGIANAVLDQGQEVQFGLNVLNGNEACPLDVAIRTKAVQLRLNSSGKNDKVYDYTHEVTEMLSQLLDEPYLRETLPDIEVEVTYAILEANLAGLVVLNQSYDNDQENDSINIGASIAYAFNLAKQSFEDFYKSSIKASGFDYSYQVLRMFAKLHSQYRATSDNIREEFKLSMPISEEKVRFDLTCLTATTPRDRTDPIATLLFS